MKKKILILSGGISKERLISLDTGKQVAKELKKNGYKIQISEPDRSLSLNIKKFKPDIIFNALHGQFGEDGYIQSILEKFNVKKIQALGEDFNANFHQAMFEKESNEFEDGKVCEIVQDGYTFHDRLLRPVLVGVAKKSNENNSDKNIEVNQNTENEEKN